MYAPPALQSLVLSYGTSIANEHRCTSICLLRRSCQHTPLLLVQRALVLGACSQEADGRVGKASSLDLAIRRVHVMHVQPAVSAPAPFLWTPVSRMNSAEQAFVIRAEVVSIRPPSSVTRTSIGGLQARSGRTGRESELSKLSHSYDRRHVRAVKLLRGVQVLVHVVVVTPTFNVPPLEDLRTGLGQSKRTGHPRR